MREILREKNLILLSRTYDSNLQIRAFSHHQSIDSSHKDFTHGGKFSRENFREKLCKKEILREGQFARDFEREESDSSIAYLRFKSPNLCIQSSSIDRFESFDLVNFLESIDSIIQIDSSRYALRKKSISKFFFLVYMRECARTNLSNL